MPEHAIVVVGASAGGLEALQALAAGLPADLPAALFVVWHMAAESPGLLPAILERAGPLPARHPQDGEAIVPGQIYVASPDQHLLLEPGHVRLTRGPKENRFRPAVDPLFRSAALAYGPWVLGVVLSGALDDGTDGLAQIKAAGGIAIVQDPRDALVPGMPESALRHVSVDHIAVAAALGPLLAELVGQTGERDPAPPLPSALAIETRIALAENALEAGVLALGSFSPYTCPECHGALLQLKTDGMLRFRCHTGHAYSVTSLLSEVSEAIEETLWSAVREIEEQMLLLRHVADHADTALQPEAVERFRMYARAAEQQAQLVRLAVLRKP